MKVKDLIEKLQKFNPEFDAVIDRDSVGWLAIADVNLVDGEDNDKLVNIALDS